MRGPFRTLFAALALSACATSPAPIATPSATAAGMVSAADPRAAAAGVEMLRLGGSATDAALAVMLALTVVEPQSSGIGGGGFYVVHTAVGATETIDGRETAPAAAHGAWFIRDGQPMAIGDAIPGGLSVGVPGNVALMAQAHRRHGKLRWARLFGPAIRLARDGYVVTPRLHKALVANRAVAGLTERGRMLYFPGGEPLAVGARVQVPALAALLERLAKHGPDEFYDGPTASGIAGAVMTAPRNPAPMVAQDLAAYRAKPRDAVCSTYRAYRLCGMGPPSSGGVAVIQILKQLERFDLAALGPNSPAAWHLIAESMRLAFADRGRYLGDPDFVAVPVAGLLAPDYLARRSSLIAPDRTIANIEAGTPARAFAAASMPEQGEQGTSHFVAVDRSGEVVSMTSTIESPFGSGLVVQDFFINNELTDFAFTPNDGGRLVANAVAPAKRPRSSMSPTIMFGPDGRVRLAVGAAGGATIIAQVAKSIIAVVDWKLSAQQAIALPVLFAPDGTLWIEQGSALEAMVPGLTALGHRDIRRRDGFKANAIEWVADGRGGGRWVGAADPRSEGTAISE